MRLAHRRIRPARHRLVVLEMRPPNHHTTGSHQTKTATVTLVAIGRTRILASGERVVERRNFVQSLDHRFVRHSPCVAARLLRLFSEEIGVGREGRIKKISGHARLNVAAVERDP